MTRVGTGQMYSAASRSRGFTLLEVLLAFVIFALGFATVLEILSASMRSTVRAREYSEAALTAQSIMDLVGTELPLVEGSQSGGADGGFDWTLYVSAWQPSDGDPYLLELAEGNGTMLYRVDLHLSWQSGFRERSADFSTVRGTLVTTGPGA